MKKIVRLKLEEARAQGYFKLYEALKYLETETQGLRMVETKDGEE